MVDNYKKTPLYHIHNKYGGKIVDFFSWLLPVQYTGIIEEHNNVRNSAGIFDVSHMGEILIEGAKSEQFLQRIITNNIKKINNNQMIYSPMCYEHGGTVDDVIIYKFSERKYLMVVNASNIAKDFNWLTENNVDDVDIKNVSDDYAQIAVQGPKAEKILQKSTSFNIEELKFFSFQEIMMFKDYKVLISRSGYTGEDGFEIYIKPEKAGSFWEKIMEAGKEEGILPCGLGARDTLRFEACLPLYGHELTEKIFPVEAGLKRFIHLDTDFIGKVAISEKLDNPQRVIVGFEMIEKGIARENYNVLANDSIIGYVTSGSFSPTLQKSLGLCIIDKQYADIDNTIDIAIRKKLIKSKIIEKPFYRRR